MVFLAGRGLSNVLPHDVCESFRLWRYPDNGGRFPCVAHQISPAGGPDARIDSRYAVQYALDRTDGVNLLYRTCKHRRNIVVYSLVSFCTHAL